MDFHKISWRFPINNLKGIQSLGIRPNIWDLPIISWLIQFMPQTHHCISWMIQIKDRTSKSKQIKTKKNPQSLNFRKTANKTSLLKVLWTKSNWSQNHQVIYMKVRWTAKDWNKGCPDLTIFFQRRQTIQTKWIWSNTIAKKFLHQILQ